jgi:hypothetical protein
MAASRRLKPFEEVMAINPPDCRLLNIDSFEPGEFKGDERATWVRQQVKEVPGRHQLFRKFGSVVPPRELTTKQERMIYLRLEAFKRVSRHERGRGRVTYGLVRQCSPSENAYLRKRVSIGLRQRRLEAVENRRKEATAATGVMELTGGDTLPKETVVDDGDDDDFFPICTDDDDTEESGNQTNGGEETTEVVELVAHHRAAGAGSQTETRNAGRPMVSEDLNIENVGQLSDFLGREFKNKASREMAKLYNDIVGACEDQGVEVPSVEVIGEYMGRRLSKVLKRADRLEQEKEKSEE